MVDILDGRGLKIGSTVQQGNQTMVFDHAGSLLGWSDSTGTYDARGGLIGGPGQEMRLLT